MSRFCFVFLHYTDAKMCLSGKELNNDGLGHNKHRINVRILLGWVGSVWQPEIFIFSILSTPPDRIYPSTRPIKFIATPPDSNYVTPLPSKLNYYI